MRYDPALRLYDSGVVVSAAGAVYFQLDLGSGAFQILGMRLAAVQLSPKGAAPVEIRYVVVESDGTSYSSNLTGGWVTEAHPYALPYQPVVVGPGRLVVATVAHSSSDALRCTILYRRFKQ